MTRLSRSPEGSRTALAVQVSRARNEWQCTADAVPDLILLVGEDGRVRRCNRAVRDLTGLDYARIVGTCAHELLGLGRPFEPVSETVRTELPWPGSRLVFEHSRYPTQIHEAGRGEVWVLRDVTALRRLEAIAASVDMMNNMGHLLSGVRHELGNPVNALKVALTVMAQGQDRFPRAKTAAYLERCLGDVERIAVLLENLRTFNGLETVRPAAIEIMAAVGKMAELLRPQVEQQGVRLECLTHPAPVRVSADLRALHQVVFGLVANACEALAGRRNPRIRIRAQAEREQVLVTVEDNGVGIPPDQLAQVFVPLFTTKPRGTGLGLAIARSLMAQMDGTLELASTPGRGTSAELSLTRLADAG